MIERRPRRPEGDVYDWYRRGLELLHTGNPAAATQLLGHAQAVEPESKSIREAMARALFNTRRYSDSAQTFRSLVEENPADDYAHFGLGLALGQLGEHVKAAGHLAMATAMRPGSENYVDALRDVRETLRELGEAGQAESAG